MDIQVFLNSMAEGAEAIKLLAVGVAMSVLGWYFMLSAGIRLAKLSNARSNVSYGFWSVVTRASIGVCFVKTSDFINMWVLTITGQLPAPSAMSVVAAPGSGISGLILQAVIVWLGTFGVIAIIRGLLLLVKSGDGGGSGQSASDRDPIFVGLVFLFSGAIGLNISQFAADIL